MSGPGTGYRVNCHFHDAASADARRALEAHVHAGAGAGLDHLCVTNHVEVPGDGGRWELSLEEAIPRFRDQARAVRRLRGREGPEVRLGAEFEFRPEWTGPLDELAEAVDFDFVIGSVHVVDGINVSGGDRLDAYFGPRDQREAYAAYFREIGRMVEWGGFDVVGHFDLVKRFGHPRYGPYRPEDFEEEIRPVLARMAEAGLGIEINTSGVVQPPAAPFPHPQILRWAREEGVPYLTIGSDSHAPEHLAQGLDEGYRLARATGWEELTVFRGRRPGAAPLGDEEARAPDARGRP